MDVNDLADLSANRKLLLATLLKRRAAASAPHLPPASAPDSSSSAFEEPDGAQSQPKQAHDPGVFGRFSAQAGHAGREWDADEPEPADPGEPERADVGDSQQAAPRGALAWLRAALRNHTQLELARKFLERAEKVPVQAQGQQPGGAAAQESPLVCMRAEGNRTPFFCVHALLGSTFHYFALANLLDADQPFYALQAPGLDGVQPPLNQIGAFAACYIKHIRQVQPKGPYKIGGYSFGGLVAFEIARQLTKAGEEVSRLIIFGTDVPISVSNHKLFKVLEFFGQYSADFHKNIVMPFFSTSERIKRGAGQSKLPISPVLVRVVVAHWVAALRYNPRPFCGNITLLETLEQQLLNPFDPSRGWNRLAAGTVQTLLVSGTHLGMLDEPHVRDLAEKLNWCLGDRH